MAKDNKQVSFGIICAAICTGILLMFCIIAASTILKQRADDKKMHAYILGRADSCGYIGVKITYDIEPVDVILYSPDGQKYIPGGKNVYYKVDHKAHTVLLLADSNRLGIWTANFNTKSNTKIDYCLVQTPSKTLYIDQPILYIGNDGSYHIKFNTSISRENHEKARCSVMLEKTDFSYCLNETTIDLNKETDIPLTFPDHVFTDQDYTINVSVFAGKNIALTKRSINVHINKRTVEIPVEKDKQKPKKSERNADSK